MYGLKVCKCYNSPVSGDFSWVLNGGFDGDLMANHGMRWEDMGRYPLVATNLFASWKMAHLVPGFTD